jgi:hypothetical protein
LFRVCTAAESSEHQEGVFLVEANALERPPVEPAIVGRITQVDVFQWDQVVRIIGEYPHSHFATNTVWPQDFADYEVFWLPW